MTTQFVAHKLSWFSTDHVGVLLRKIKKIPKLPTDGWLSQHQLGFLLAHVVDNYAVDNIIIHSNNGDKTTSGVSAVRTVFGLLFSKISNIESIYHEKDMRNNPRNRQSQHTIIQPTQLPVLRPPC